jgi:hypothetical protein
VPARSIAHERRCACPRSLRPRTADDRRPARTRPTRWIPGTAPIIRLPLAGKGAPSRNNRAGRKPASIGSGQLSAAEREEMELLVWELGAEGVRFGPPDTWEDCVQEIGDRPCPHVSCAANLYLDVVPPKNPGEDPVIKLNFPGLDVDEIPETCAVRAGIRGAATLEEIGKRLNVTMARAEQLEKAGLRKLAAVAHQQGWGENFRRFIAKARTTRARGGVGTT